MPPLKEIKMPRLEDSYFDFNRVSDTIGQQMHREIYCSDLHQNSQGHRIGMFLRGLDRHAHECKIFNGFSIARSAEDLHRNSRGYRRYLRCTCGIEWEIDNSMFEFRYRDANIEDLIQDLNHQYFEQTRGTTEEKIEKAKEVKVKGNIEKARNESKTAISFLEVE